RALLHGADVPEALPGRRVSRPPRIVESLEARRLRPRVPALQERTAGRRTADLSLGLHALAGQQGSLGTSGGAAAAPRRIDPDDRRRGEEDLADCVPRQSVLNESVFQNGTETLAAWIEVSQHDAEDLPREPCVALRHGRVGAKRAVGIRQLAVAERDR